MKKLLVVTSYFYPDTGGTATHTYNLYKHISESSDYQITILSSAKKYSSKKIGSLKVVRLPYRYKVLNTPVNFEWIFKIVNIIRRLKPDVIMVHTPVVFMADIATFASGNIPVILKYHHGGSMKKGIAVIDFFIGLYEKTIFKYLLNKAKIIVSASDYVADNYLKEYREKVITITPGVDLKKFTPVKNKEKSGLLFVANLNEPERYKGLEYLLKAIQIIRKKIPKIKLEVVGGGDFEVFYRRLARKLDIESNVIFRGKMVGKPVVECFQKCNLFVLPSLFESSPNVLLEAMACQKPIAATNTAGIPYLIKDGVEGLLFPPENPLKIAKTVIRILKNKSLAIKFGRNGLKKVRNYYSWEQKAKETQNLINKVLFRP